MIEVKNITKVFEEKVAVKNISFSVEKGEILGFLGPNGAGKTTTMRILTCFFPPTSGDAFVGGYSILHDQLKVRKKIGYLPENIPLYPEMKVLEYLQFIGTLKGMSNREKKHQIPDIMEKCRIGEVATVLNSHLSKGYKQRVGIAQAMLGNPDVLILDEPTLGLDPKQIKETRELIKNLGKEKTIILSTHILPEVSMVCNRIVIINKGEVIAVDTPAGLLERLEGKTQWLNLTIRGNKENIIKELKETDFVKNISCQSYENNIGKYTIEIANEISAREKIAHKIVQSGWGLLEMVMQKASLEDIFLQLITSE